MPIILRVHQLLNERGWTAYELAKRAKISQTLAYRLKNNARFKRLDHDTLWKLCATFKVQPGELLLWDGKNPPSRHRFRK